MHNIILELFQHLTCSGDLVHQVRDLSEKVADESDRDTLSLTGRFVGKVLHLQVISHCGGRGMGRNQVLRLECSEARSELRPSHYNGDKCFSHCTYPSTPSL